MKPQTPDNEVARLREELDRAMDSLSDEKLSSHRAEAEVARLRGLLKDHAEFLRQNGFAYRAEELMRGYAPAPEEPLLKCKCDYPSFIAAEHDGKWYNQCSKCGKKFKAPAPEEPDNDWKCPHCGSTTGTWFSRVEPMGDICEDCGKAVDEEPVIQENRITELRKSISSAINSVSAENGSDTPDFILADFLTDCLEAWNTATKRRNDWYAPKGLAPAPEEPVSINQMSINSFIASCEQEPAPEWRELGQDEVICEGDEVQPKHHSRDGEWIKAWPYEVGVRSGFYNSMRYRTRRPLPKQEEMPLEKEIQFLKERNWDLDPIPTITTCLVYLRDEIQKLKSK